VIDGASRLNRSPPRGQGRRNTKPVTVAAWTAKPRGL
jgi:hypothetical protein